MTNSYIPSPELERAIAAVNSFRRRQAGLYDAAATEEMAARVLATTELYPSMSPELVVGVASSGLPLDAPAINAIAVRDAQDQASGGPLGWMLDRWDDVTGLGRAGVRGVFTGFQTVWEEGIARPVRVGVGVAQGQGLGEAYEKSGESAGVTALRTALRDPVGSFTPAASRPDAEVNLGSGFFPNSDLAPETQELIGQGFSASQAVAQVGNPGLASPITQLAREQAETGIQLHRNGHSVPVSPGRVLAIQVFEPGSTQFNVMSGAADFAAQIFADPSNVALKGVSKGRAIANTFAGPGTVSGVRKTVLRQNAEQWLTSRPGRNFTQWASEANASQIRQALKGTNPDTAIPRSVIAELADADTASKAADVLRSQLGITIRRSPVPASITSRTLGTPTVSEVASGIVSRVSRTQAGAAGGFWPTFRLATENTRLGHLFSSANARSVSVYNLDRGLDDFHDFLASTSLNTERTASYLDEFARLSDGDYDQAYDIVRRSLDEFGAEMTAAGLDPQAVRAATQMVEGSLPDLRKYFVDRAGGIENAPWLVRKIMGDDVMRDIPEPHLITEYLDSNIPLPNPRLIRRAVTQADQRLAIMTRLTSRADTLQSRAGVYYLDKFMSKIWKPLALLRPAFTVRVIAEEQARMAGAGIDSMFNHPLQYFAWRTAKKGQIDVLGDEISQAFEYQRAMSRTAQDVFDAPYGSQNWTIVPKTDPKRASHWGRELNQHWEDPVSQHLAEFGSVDETARWLHSEGSEVLDDLRIGRRGHVEAPDVTKADIDAAMAPFSHIPIAEMGPGSRRAVRELATLDLSPDVQKFIALEGDDMVFHGTRKGEEFGDLTSGGISNFPERAAAYAGPDGQIVAMRRSDLPEHIRDKLARGEVEQFKAMSREDMVDELFGTIDSGYFGDGADEALLRNLAEGRVDVDALLEPDTVATFEAAYQRFRDGPDDDAIAELLNLVDGNDLGDEQLEALYGLIVQGQGIARGDRAIPIAGRIAGVDLAQFHSRSSEYGMFKVVGRGVDDPDELAAMQGVLAQTRKARQATAGVQRYVESVYARMHLKTGGAYIKFDDASGSWIDDAGQVVPAADVPPGIPTGLGYYVTRSGNDELLESIATGRFRGQQVRNRFEGKGWGKTRDELETLADEFMPDNVKAAIKPDMTHWDSALDKAFSALMGVRTNNLSRAPAFKQFYWQSAAELLPYATEDVARHVLKTATEQAGFSANEFRKLARGAIAGHPDAAVQAAARTGSVAGIIDDARRITSAGDLDDIAKAFALDETRNLLYDLAKRRQITDINRNLAPFAEAYLEIITSWSRIMQRNPQSIRRFQQALEGGRDSGWFYEDPTTGDEVFNYPGSNLLSDSLFGEGAAGLQLTGRVQGLNLIGGSLLPGIGPVVQTPASELLPHTPQWDGVRDWLFPYGTDDIESVGDIAETVVPAWMNKAFTAIGSFTDPDQQRLYANTVMATYATMGLNGQLTGDQATDLESARTKARWIYAVRAGAQAIGPTGPLVSYNVEDTEGTVWNFGVLSQEYRSMKDANEGDEAVTYMEFTDRFGVDPTWLATAKTETTVRRSVTEEGSKFQRANQDLFTEYPATAYYALPDGADDEFDYGAYLEQLKEGSRVGLTPEQWAAKRNDLLGRIAYDRARRSILEDDDGTTRVRTDTEAVNWLRTVRQFLVQEYPGYRQEIVGTINRASREQKVAELDGWVDEPRLADTEAGQAVKLYMLARRRIVADSQSQLELSPTGWQTAKKARYMRDWLTDIAQALRERYPSFEAVWDEVLRWEVDGDTEPRPVTIGGVTFDG